MRSVSLSLRSMSTALSLVAASACGADIPAEPTSLAGTDSEEPVAINYVQAPLGPTDKDVCPDHDDDPPADDNDPPADDNDGEDPGTDPGPDPVVEEPDDGEFVLSTAYRDVWVGESKDEARVDLPADYVLVGVGVRIGGLFTDVTTLVAHARQLEDGKLGDIREFRGGSDPNHGLEVYCEAPSGYVITGIGGRVKGADMTTLHVWSRPFDPETGELGEVEVEPTRCGSDPNHVVEQRLVTWEHTPSDAVDTTVWNGISMRAAWGDLTSIRARLRTVEAE